MARFGRQFLSQLGNPAGMLQGAANLGGAIGGVPGQIEDKRLRAEEADELKNSGLAPGTAGYLAIQARHAVRRGDRQLALKYASAATQAKESEVTLEFARAKAVRDEAANTRAEAREGRDLITHGQGVLAHQQDVTTFGQEQTEYTQEQSDRAETVAANAVISAGIINDLKQALITKKNVAGEPLSRSELKRIQSLLINAADQEGNFAYKLADRRDALLGKKEKDSYLIYDAAGNQVRFVDLNEGYPELKPGEFISKIPSTVYEGSVSVTGEKNPYNIAPKQFAGALADVNIIREATGVVNRVRGGLEGNVITTEMVAAEDNIGAYQILISTVKDVEAAFANNPRFAEGERRQIADLGLSKLAQSVFASESAIRSKLQASVDMFEGMRIREINFQNDPNTESGAKSGSQNRAKMLSESISKIKGILQSGQQEAGQQQDGIPPNVDNLVNLYSTSVD